LVYVVSIDEAAELLATNSNIGSDKFNPNAYPNYQHVTPAGNVEEAHVSFVSEKLPPKDPLILGIFGSAFESADSGDVITGPLKSKIDEAAYMTATLNQKYHNLMVVSGACPDYSIPAYFIRRVKEHSKSLGEEVYTLGVHPGVESQILGSKDDLYGNNDAVIFTNYFNVWNSITDEHLRWSRAFRDRDSRNCDWPDAGIFSAGGIGTGDEMIGISQNGGIVAALRETGGASDHFAEFRSSFYNGDNVLLIEDHNPSQLIKRTVGQIHYDRLKIKEITVVDLRPDHSHIWNVLAPKRFEPGVWGNLFLEGAFNHRHPAYRGFAFELRPGSDRSILPITIENTIDLVELKPNPTEPHHGDKGMIHELHTFDRTPLEEKVGVLREAAKPFIWHQSG